jgi:UDP-N-acetylglucosamine 2-epimerase (non-hydrolysing)
MKTPPISIATVFGTRPEAVKLLPVIRELKTDQRFDLSVVVTGQHREMLREILEPFGIVPDVDLEIMRPGQSLNDIVCRAMPRLDELYARKPPDVVLVQGDTTSAFCAGLAASNRRIPVAHVEAGLRSFDRFHPYPEETNRRMLSAVCELHFAPTQCAAQNLLNEGVAESSVLVTGNTVIDALLLTLREGFSRRLDDEPSDGAAERRERRSVLITMHRREALESASEADGASILDGILGAIRRTADRHPDVDFVYPVHLNPKVQEAARRALSGAANAVLSAPLPYLRFVKTMARASVIVTDSGGVQEEAPSLGIPVLVLRRTTERPEGIGAGKNRLVGTDPGEIEAALSAALDSPSDDACAATLPRPNPFGDGRASTRIAQAVLHFFGAADAPEEFVAPEDEDQARGHRFTGRAGGRAYRSTILRH